jgi:hypothetical protein
VPNFKRNFDSLIIKKLDFYVYTLRDPRDNKVFYVGEGTGDRVFSHFSEAESHNPNPSAKVRRILEIWAQDLDVEWQIVRHGMSEQSQALEIEAAVIDVLDASMNGPALNEIRGQHVDRGILFPSDIDALQAAPVNPTCQMTVFVFPVREMKARLESDQAYYEATKGDWRITDQYRQIKPAYAVGLTGGISHGAYRIKEWKKSNNNSGKWYFETEAQAEPQGLGELLNKSWLNIISPAKGFYMRGNHLVVNFNGSGEFQIIRGCPNHTLTPCDDTTVTISPY